MRGLPLHHALYVKYRNQLFFRLHRRRDLLFLLLRHITFRELVEAVADRGDLATEGLDRGYLFPLSVCHPFLLLPLILHNLRLPKLKPFLKGV